MRPVFEDVIETGRSFSLSKKYYNQYLREALGHGAPELDFEDEDSFWVPLKGKDEKTGQFKIQGYVRLSFSIMTKIE